MKQKGCLHASVWFSGGDIQAQDILLAQHAFLSTHDWSQSSHTIISAARHTKYEE